MQLCVTLLLCLQDGEEEGAPPHQAGPPPGTGHFIREGDLAAKHHCAEWQVTRWFDKLREAAGTKRPRKRKAEKKETQPKKKRK